MKIKSFLLVLILFVPNHFPVHAGEKFGYFPVKITVSLFNTDSIGRGNDSGIRLADEGERHDSWTSRDKFYHLFVSAALSGGGYWALEATNNREDQSAAACFGITSCIGGLKEIYDYHHPEHHASWKDFTADLIGAALGVFIAWSL